MRYNNPFHPATWNQGVGWNAILSKQREQNLPKRFIDVGLPL